MSLERILKKGFTITELLVVVAVISIISAIAIPNYFRAQIRAKVAAVNAYQLTLVTAVESYLMDSGTYPINNVDLPVPANGTHGTYLGVVPQLTSPVAYIASNPSSPFKKSEKLKLPPSITINDEYKLFAPWHLFVNQSSPNPVQFVGNPPNLKPLMCPYSLIRDIGPDNCFNIELPFPENTLLMSYDPTNGTISRGDIIRLTPKTVEF